MLLFSPILFSFMTPLFHCGNCFVVFVQTCQVGYTRFWKCSVDMNMSLGSVSRIYTVSSCSFYSLLLHSMSKQLCKHLSLELKVACPKSFLHWWHFLTFLVTRKIRIYTAVFSYTFLISYFIPVKHPSIL